jgi:mercuric ion transport protein
MIQVELIYDADCPAAGDARRNLRQALLHANLPPRWAEWERSSPTTPRWMQAFGSPTILVNRRDVGGIEASGATYCRIYQRQPGRLAAVPPIEMIAAALRQAGVEGGKTANTGAPKAK